MKTFLSDSNRSVGAWARICPQTPLLMVARRAFAGSMTRFVTAPSGSETMSATADAVSFTHPRAASNPAPTAPHTPPSAKETLPRRAARPRPREALTRSSQGLPPRARRESGRMIPSPPDMRMAPPPSGEKK